VSNYYAGNPHPNVAAEADHELVAKVLAGRTDAYTQLVSRYYGQVYAIAYSYLQQREAAEELAQDVFVRGFLHLDKLADRDRFAHWLSRIARNLALNWLRDHRRRSEVLKMLPLDGVQEEPRDSSPSPRDAASAAELEKWLQEALATLPPDLREAVLLHFFENVPKNQIAELQGVNPSTLGRRIDAALLQLQAKLAEGALHQLKGGWVPRGAKGATAAVAAAAALPKAAQAAIAAKTADSLILSSVSSAAPAATTTATSSTLKTGAAAMISKTGIAVAATSLVILGAVALPSLRKQLGEPIKADAAEVKEDTRSTAFTGDIHARSRNAPPAPKTAAATPRRAAAKDKPASPTLAKVVTSEAEAAPLDSGTTEVDPTNITTATATVTVRNERQEPIAGARVATHGARLAEDPRIWTWNNASGVTDAKGQVQLSVLQSIQDLQVKELVLSAHHPAYQPNWQAQASFSLTPEIIMKDDKTDKNILRVTVKDEAGQPIEGVTVQGHHMRAEKKPSTSYGWMGTPFKQLTSAEGLVAVTYPTKIVSEEQQVTTVSLGFYHRDYTSDRIELGVNPPDQEVTLKRGAELVVSGYIDSPEQLVTGVQVNIDDDAGANLPWDEGGKSSWEELDSTHLLNRKLKSGTRALHAFVVRDGRRYYSDTVRVEVEKGQRKELSLQLKPSIRVRGKLSDNVPRPVVNGEFKWEMPNVEIKGPIQLWGQMHRPLGLTHSGQGRIETDGTFDLGELPSGKMELVAICNGWRSTNGVSLRPEMRQQLTVTPQVFDIAPEISDITLQMEQTASFRATVLKPDGTPLQGATVGFSPNAFFLNYSTSFIRQTGFTAPTDAAGNVVIADLPAGGRIYGFIRPPKEWEVPAEIKKQFDELKLEPGKVAEMVIKVVPKKAGGDDAQ